MDLIVNVTATGLLLTKAMAPHAASYEAVEVQAKGFRLAMAIHPTARIAASAHVGAAIDGRAPVSPGETWLN